MIQKLRIFLELSHPNDPSHLRTVIKKQNNNFPHLFSLVY